MTSTPLGETRSIDAGPTATVPAATVPAAAGSSPAPALVAVPCAECGAPVDARFCARCGERRLEARDFSIAALVANALQNVANFDSRLLHTVRDLVTRPGRLTADYMSGRRNRQTQPLTLFLTINVVFFIAIANANLLRWPLAQYERTLAILPVSAETVRGLVRDRAASEGLSHEAFARRFDSALRDRQKAMLVVVVPLFALAVGAATWRRRRPAVQHLVFAIHFYAFYLLWFGFGVRGLIMGLYHAMRLVAPVAAARTANALGSEEGLTLLLLAGSTAYLRLALSRAYGMSRAPAWLAAFALALTVVVVLLWLFRDLIFFVTLYTV